MLLPKKINFEDLKDQITDFFDSAEREQDECHNDPERYDDYFIDHDYDRCYKSIRDLLQDDEVFYDQVGRLSDVLTPSTIDHILVHYTEIELTSGYHLAENTIDFIALYGTEWEYEVELPTEITDQLLLLNNIEIELLNTEFHCNINDTHILRYNTYDCTPCLVISDIDSLKEYLLQQVNRKSNKTPKTDDSSAIKYSALHCIDGGVSFTTIDIIRHRMKKTPSYRRRH